VYDAAQTGELLGVDRCTVIRWVQLELLHGLQHTFFVPWRIRVTAAGGDLRDPGLPGLADAGVADPSYGSRGRV
jgi:hypothetical protein